jgi:amidase
VGPLARTADDLELALDVLAGPDRWMSPAWTLDLPPSRADELSEFRIAAWIDDDACPVDADTRRVLGDTVEAITAAGGTVDTEARPGFTLSKAMTVYGELLFAALSGGVPKDRLDEYARVTADTPTGWIMRSSATRHRSWLSNNERRLQIRERWAEFFAGFDAILLPVHPRPALHHDHSMPQFERVVDIDGRERPYLDLWTWIAPAGLGALPATVVPVGTSADGLPIGVQIVGPFLHDRTTIHLARLISQIMSNRNGWPAACPRPPTTPIPKTLFA